MKLLGFTAFMAFATSISMIDGIYADAAFIVMIVSGLVLCALGKALEKKGSRKCWTT